MFARGPHIRRLGRGKCAQNDAVVYLLERGFNYEGNSIIGVYATKMAAIAVAHELMADVLYSDRLEVTATSIQSEPIVVDDTSMSVIWKAESKSLKEWEPDRIIFDFDDDEVVDLDRHQWRVTLEAGAKLARGHAGANT